MGFLGLEGTDPISPDRLEWRAIQPHLPNKPTFTRDKQQQRCGLAASAGMIASRSLTDNVVKVSIIAQTSPSDQA
jgi:hypothetical protein